MEQDLIKKNPTVLIQTHGLQAFPAGQWELEDSLCGSSKS